MARGQAQNGLVWPTTPPPASHRKSNFPIQRAPSAGCPRSAFLVRGRSVIGRAMTLSFSQRFLALAKERSPLCIGIDPSAEALKGWGLPDDVAGLRAFCQGLVETCAPLVASVKPQSAFFERHGPAGLEVLRQTVEAATAHGALVIVDAKRGDIGSTAVAYGE